MANRFNLSYTDRDGKEQRPYIIHRAPLSTHERLISFLIESYGGAFPTWMAPVQVKLVPVGDHVLAYARNIKAKLHQAMIRVDIDEGSDTFNKKIRNAVTTKTPNMWIIGGNEAENGTITWRRYCTRKQLELPVDQAIATISRMYKQRTMDNFDDVELPE